MFPFEGMPDEDLVAAGRFLHIPVLDHVIIPAKHIYSFADEGLLWTLPFELN